MKQFFEFPDLKEFALVTTVVELFEVTAAPGKARFTIKSDVADYVRLSAQAPKFESLKGCKFQLLAPEGNGYEYISFDSKGKPEITYDAPDWSMNENDYARQQWVANKGYDVRSGVELLEELMTYDLTERRKLADILLSLDLDKKPLHRSYARGTTGNRNGKSTKPKVMDLGSYELFKAVYDRLSDAVNSDQFPTLQVLTGLDDLTKAPTNLKQACRTYFKAITSELPPNNKVVEKGHPEIMCSKIRAILEEVERVGVEDYYKQLAESIAEAADKDTTIADFKFRYTE
ncbi:TPA: hypothetical protein JG872_000363 [Enterobacter hormaechei subsp. xiangfangensis]|uniref:hypothetical protein n=1 Tax=Enterobacter hormaechei TaxID=158836 RepID=UPI001C1A0CC3|nr:hypothetical protein [Enterobacter hormaechei subsp. xiangfangensis]HAV1860669.1 hypothetical protein [Enterobacter hormaechei subsp. xiangfangensis]